MRAYVDVEAQNLNPVGAVRAKVPVANAPRAVSVITGPSTMFVQMFDPPVYDDVSRDIEVLTVRTRTVARTPTEAPSA
jgi:hypothetical protein